jgi:hypothetical protein
LATNNNAPNGFQFHGSLEGAAPTEGLTRQFVSSGDTSSLGYGDPVQYNTSGYVTAVATGPTTQIAGIFYGCDYVSTTLQKRVWLNYWAGSGAAGDVTVRVCTDPNALFIAQSDNTAIASTNIGLNINLVSGTPNSTTQFSTAAVGESTISTTNTLPFRIIDMLSSTAPPGTNGTVNTAAFNRVIVAPNNWDRKSLAGL